MPDGTSVVTLDDVTVNASPAAPAATPRKQTDDTLSLVVDQTEWIGWQRVNVTLSLEQVPSTFDIEVTEKYPTGATIDIKPGSPCQVKIGGDLVITGYIDRYSAAIAPTAHSVRITGRSKSEDLVDCAAFVGDKDNPSYQITGGTTLSIIQQLAKPYGVEVQSDAGPGSTVPLFNINLGETVWEIVDRLTKNSGLLAYDMPDGSVMLSQAGNSGSMGSGFAQGVNVESAEVAFTMDQRFSEYEGFQTSTLAFTKDSGGHTARGVIATDEGVPRYRKRIIIAEQVQPDGAAIIEKRVQWEKNRRMGRSTAITIVCDSWRDSGGKLWMPNYLAPIAVAALKVPNASWCIGNVTFTRNEQGQHASVMLMPKEAFVPAPELFLPLPPLLGNLQTNNPTAPGPIAPGAAEVP